MAIYSLTKDTLSLLNYSIDHRFYLAPESFPYQKETSLVFTLPPNPLDGPEGSTTLEGLLGTSSQANRWAVSIPFLFPRVVENTISLREENNPENAGLPKGGALKVWHGRVATEDIVTYSCQTNSALPSCPTPEIILLDYNRMIILVLATGQQSTSLLLSEWE